MTGQTGMSWKVADQPMGRRLFRLTNPERPPLSRLRLLRCRARQFSTVSHLPVIIARPPKSAWNRQKTDKESSFNMAQATSGLVDYGTTSEEDNFSDFESTDVEGPGSPLPAETACLGMSRWCSDAWLSPDDRPTSGREQSDSELHQSPQVHAGPSPEVLTINSSTQEEPETAHGGQARQPSACRREDQQTHGPSDAGDTSDSDSSNSTSPRPPSPVLVHSSSQEEDQKPATKRPRLQTSARGAQGRGAYALKSHQLTPELRDLLARSRAFFTKPHSLQRPGGPVSTSTYSKAEERILCKSLRCLSLPSCRRRHVHPVAPEV